MFVSVLYYITRIFTDCVIIRRL